MRVFGKIGKGFLKNVLYYFLRLKLTHEKNA